ncbi:MAG: helix-turn-helix transcriptional regulator [Clostridia bacterium]|nr:helix-turn-helix transcriptional regulator [Clostridia bacterium]
MVTFNSAQFGNTLKAARLKKELSLEYVGRKVGKNSTTIGRYEKGEIIPDAEILSKLCTLLDIYTGNLYSSPTTNIIINLENSKNPFQVDKLYLYYKGYVGKKKIGKFKFVLDLIENKDYLEVRISDYKTRKTILIGSMLADDNIVSIRTENYKPNCPRLETNQIIVNISEGTNGIILGTMLCTNGNYIPNVKKCLLSKKDLIFTDTMLAMLTVSAEERANIQKDDIWLVDIEQIQNYEYQGEA